MISVELFLQLLCSFYISVALYFILSLRSITSMTLGYLLYVACSETFCHAMPSGGLVLTSRRSPYPGPMGLRIAGHHMTRDGIMLRCLSPSEAQVVLKEAHDNTCGAQQPGPNLGYHI